MFRDPLARKAWEVRQQADRVPSEVLIEAAVWLEEKYRQAPGKELASALAVQYFILARRYARGSLNVAKEYARRALRWRDAVERLASTPPLLPARLHLN